MLKGYKTIIGAAIMAASAALSYLGYTELSESFRTFAFGVLAIGLGGKIENK